MVGAALLLLLATLCGYALVWAIRRNDHWKKRGVKHLKPIPFLGNLLPMMLGKRNISQVVDDICKAFPNEPVVGFYEFMTPRLIIKDIDLVQKVLVKDFGHFVDHGFEVDEEKNPLDAQLFVMSGNRWRAFRTKMTPLFTSGKLKSMYDTMTDCGKDLLAYMARNSGKEMDMREAMGLFSMDIIGSAAFGIIPGVLNNPDSEFRTMGKKLSVPNIIHILKMWLFFAFPGVVKKLGLSFQDRTVTNYFCDIIRNAIKYRKDNNIQRSDFVEMMVQLKEKGNVELKKWDAADDYLKNESQQPITESFEITDDILMAQAQAFLMAGFEATALLLTYSMVEICQQPEMQEKIRQEVIEQANLHGGVTYEALKNMKYLEQTVKETQRLYELVPLLFRMCTQDYTLPNGYKITKGDYVVIPVHTIHMNPNIYPDPKSFKPERFEEQPKPGTFLPFGEGPRMCIAMRYAMLVIKYGLAVVLMNYKATLSPKTKTPISFNNRAFGAIPKDKILFNVEKISMP